VIPGSNRHCTELRYSQQSKVSERSEYTDLITDQNWSSFGVLEVYAVELLVLPGDISNFKNGYLNRVASIIARANMFSFELVRRIGAVNVEELQDEALSILVRTLIFLVHLMSLRGGNFATSARF
jgi:hypothetical protein